MLATALLLVTRIDHPFMVRRLDQSREDVIPPYFDQHVCKCRGRKDVPYERRDARSGCTAQQEIISPAASGSQAGYLINHHTIAKRQSEQAFAGSAYVQVFGVVTKVVVASTEVLHRTTAQILITVSAFESFILVDASPNHIYPITAYASGSIAEAEGIQLVHGKV